MATLWEYSHYQFSFERYDERARLYTTEYEPFTYQDLPDNIEHEVMDGDTWHSIAHKYWSPIFESNNLWIYIADFQTQAVVDPFITLKAGTIVVVPSRNTLFTKILNPDRRNIVG